MANKNEAKAPEPVKAPEPTMPDVSNWDSVGLDIAGWYKPEVTGVVWGKLVGFQVINDKRGEPRNVYLVALGAPVKAVQKGGDAIQLDKGQIIGLAERAKLTDLRNYVTNNGLVYIKPLKKVQLDGGRSMWTFEARCKGTKAPLVTTTADNVRGGRDDDDSGDDIPF